MLKEPEWSVKKEKMRRPLARGGERRGQGLTFWTGAPPLPKSNGIGVNRQYELY